MNEEQRYWIDRAIGELKVASYGRREKYGLICVMEEVITMLRRVIDYDNAPT